MKLSKSEEQVMHYIWKLDKATMKDIIDLYAEPKPAMTTIATLLKRMKDKGYIDYSTIGKAREYFPTVSRTEYFASHFRGIIKNFFGDSAAQFASFFTEATDLSEEELTELRAAIDKEITRKKRKK